MGSATRSARGVVNAVVATTKGLNLAAGAAVLAAGRAIGDVPALRSALANPVADAKAKAALVDSALGKLDATATTLLHAIVAERWSSDTDILAGIEEAGIRVIAAAANDPIEDELFAVGRAVAAHPELELALSAKRGGADAKRSLADSALKGTSAATTEIVRHLVSQPRGRRIRALLQYAEKLVADQRGLGVATITVASHLAEPQRKRIAEILRARNGREHHIDVIDDQSIIGGFIIQVGNDTIDASIRSRLTELSSKLAG